MGSESDADKLQILEYPRRVPVLDFGAKHRGRPATLKGHKINMN